jgi:DNA repair photolyase
MRRGRFLTFAPIPSNLAFVHITLEIIMAEGEPFKGRGTSSNPPNRFEALHYERDPDDVPEECPAPVTQFFKDSTRSIIAHNDSPDIGFEVSLNPYRGCEHGCIYCYARPFHEYLGFSAGLDFETKIMVKEDAPQLLRKELASPKWQPKMLAIGGVTDPYQPIERRLQLTRRCLEVLVDFRNPVGVVTKNQLVTRDIDLLGDLARHQAAVVLVSVTTLDRALTRRLEPRTTQPAGRLEAIRQLTAAGIPTGVLVAPLIPGLTDHELPSILAAVRQAGAQFAGYVLLRLPLGVASLFETWLDQHFPEKKNKVLNRVRELREGKLNQSKFGQRMRGQGTLADLYENLFDLACRKAGIPAKGPNLSTDAFRRPNQTPLFDNLS